MNRRGLGLLEVVVSMTIMTIIIGALMRLNQTVVKGSRTSLDMSAITRALNLVQADIVRDDRFLPPQEFPAAANPLDSATLDPFLDDPRMARQRCYNRLGTEVLPSDTIPDCRSNPATYFRITYVKFRQPDVSFFENPDNPQAARGNPLNRIPIGHYRLRVEYPADDTGRSLKRIYASRLVTSQVVY